MDIKTIQKNLKAQKLSGRLFMFGNMFIDEDILPEENQIRELTGFTGSYALLFITPGKAYLFVDGRYELQASHEVDLSQVGIICTTTQHTTPLEWMKSKLPPKFKLGFDPWLISCRDFQKWEQQLERCSSLYEMYPGSFDDYFKRS